MNEGVAAVRGSAGVEKMGADTLAAEYQKFRIKAGGASEGAGVGQRSQESTVSAGLDGSCTWAVNSLNTRINKVSTVKMREYTGEALLCKGKTGGKHPNYTHTLTLVDLLQPAIPSSMRVRQMEAECVPVRVDIEDVMSLEGCRDDLVAQRLVVANVLLMHC